MPISPDVVNVLVALTDHSELIYFSSEEESEEEKSEEEEESEEKDRATKKTPHTPDPLPPSDDDFYYLYDDDEVDLDIFIKENKILQELDNANINNINTTRHPAESSSPNNPTGIFLSTKIETHDTIDYEDPDFDFDYYTSTTSRKNENDRIQIVKQRLLRKLAEKQLTPSDTSSPQTDPTEIGKTLLQQVMEADVKDMADALAKYKNHVEECRLRNLSVHAMLGTSKALPAQYAHKVDAADDARKRENRHHAGSHYHMAASKSIQKKKIQGLLSRHSAQGSKLQAARMEARNSKNAFEGGDAEGGKNKKKGRKSTMKSTGEAGGSKKGK